MRAEPGRILLVDRSRGSLLFQATILGRRDSAIETALAGSEGLQKARKERPHLIIFSFDLADMDAPEFCREVRQEETTRAISLLLVADREAPEQADLTLSAGCNDVIYRPLHRHELDAKVAKLTSIPIRRRLRTMTKLEVSPDAGPGQLILGRSLNISANGMLVETDHVLPGVERIRLHFYLPGDPKPLQIEGQMLRADFTGTMARYGVRFVALADDERSRIERYVDRMRGRESGA